MKCLSLLGRAALTGLLAVSLAGCFGKPPPEQRYLRVALSETPCPGSASQQHRRSANYCFVDGHIEMREFSTIFDPTRRLDQWHPGLAH